MLRFVKEDPLEIVVCFPLEPIRQGASADGGACRSSRDDASTDASAVPTPAAALCSSSMSAHENQNNVLGDDDDDLVLRDAALVAGGSAALAESAVWLHRSVTGSSADLHAALMAPTTGNATPAVNSLHVKVPSSRQHVLSHAPNGGGVCSILDAGTAIVCCVGMSACDGRQRPCSEEYAELGRIALRRPLRSTPHVGCTLSFLDFERQQTFCVAASEPEGTELRTMRSPRGSNGQQPSISFEYTDEVEEYVVSSAVHRVCFACPDNADAMLAIVLFRCGRLGALSVAATAGSAAGEQGDRKRGQEAAAAPGSSWCIRPQCLSTRDAKRGVPLELAVVPRTALCVATYVTHTHGTADGGAMPSTTLVVFDARAACAVLYERVLGPSAAVPTPLACTAPVSRDKYAEVFHVWWGGATDRVLNRLGVEVSAAPHEAVDVAPASPLRVVRAWDCSTLQATAERSYFADSNIELPPVRLASIDVGVETGPFSPSGLAGHCTPALLQLLSAISHEGVVDVCTSGCRLATPTQAALGKQPVATAAAGTGAYERESIVVLVWPQAVLLLDPNFDEGANVVGAIRMTRSNDCFVRAWLDTRRGVHQGDLLLHVAHRDGGISTYRLVCRRDGAASATPPTSLPLTDVELLTTVRGGRSYCSATWMFPRYYDANDSDAAATAAAASSWSIVQLTIIPAATTTVNSTSSVSRHCRRPTHDGAESSSVSSSPPSVNGAQTSMTVSPSAASLHTVRRCTATVWLPRGAADGGQMLERMECRTPTSPGAAHQHHHHGHQQHSRLPRTTELLRIQMVDINDGPVVLMTLTDGTVSYSPLGGSAEDVAMLRHGGAFTAEACGPQPQRHSEDVLCNPHHETAAASACGSGGAPLQHNSSDASHDVVPTREHRPCSDAPVTSALLSHRVEGANRGVLLLVTGHADGTVEVWGHCRCLASHRNMHLAAVENLVNPVDGGSAFLRERVAFMSVSAVGGTVVLHGRGPEYGALRRLASPFEGISRMLWDTSTDVVMLTGCTTGCSNVWLANSGRLERVVVCHPDAQQALAATPRISVLNIPLRPPTLVAANAVCDYTTVSFVGCTEHVFQVAMTPLLACVHAEVTAWVSRTNASQYRDMSPTSPGDRCPLSKRVSLALAHCLAVPIAPDEASAAIDEPGGGGTARPHRHVLAPPFEVLYNALQLPRHSHPAARCVDVARLLKTSGAQTTRIYVLLLSLLKVLEPLAGAAVTGPCASYLLVHVLDLPPLRASSSSLSSSPPASPTAPLALPCVAACVPYVLHNLIAVQEAAQATMDAVVRRLSPASAVRLLQGDPLDGSSSSTAAAVAGGCAASICAAHQHITVEDRECLGRVVLAMRLSHSPLMSEASVRQTVSEVARELESHITAWATECSPPPQPGTDSAGTAGGSLPPHPTSVSARHQQPVVLSVFAEAWLLWEPLMAHSDDTIDLVFAKCVAQQQVIDYRLNHGARALVAIGGRNFNRFVLLAERWFTRVPWRAPLILLFGRLVQQHPSAMVASFPTAVLHFVWLALDPHTPHRADREAACVAVAQLLRMSVHVLPNIAFNQSLQHLVVGHDDGQVYLYDAKAARVLSCFHSHAAPIACVAYHSGTTQEIAVVSAALDVVRFWRVGRSHGIMGLLSSVSGGTTCHVVGAVDIPLSEAARSALALLPNLCMPPEMVAASCRLAWLSPNCVELQTPWHNRIQLTVGYGK